MLWSLWLIFFAPRYGFSNTELTKSWQLLHEAVYQTNTLDQAFFQYGPGYNHSLSPLPTVTMPGLNMANQMSLIWLLIPLLLDINMGKYFDPATNTTKLVHAWSHYLRSVQGIVLN